MKKRFEETGQRTYAFLGEVLVHCPRCEQCAHVITWPPDTQLNRPIDVWSVQKRLACLHCGYVKDSQPPHVWHTGLCDPYFGSTLWLQTACCGEVLWAYNEEHLDFLESFVAAELREAYPNGTTASRLPKWMKLGKNRADVLKCIRTLRERVL